MLKSKTLKNVMNEPQLRSAAAEWAETQILLSEVKNFWEASPSYLASPHGWGHSMLLGAYKQTIQKIQARTGTLMQNAELSLFAGLLISPVEMEQSVGKTVRIKQENILITGFNPETGKIRFSSARGTIIEMSALELMAEKIIAGDL